MVDKFEELYEEVMMLSEVERARLRELLEMMPSGDFASSELEKAWVEEAERVSRAVHEGREKTYPAAEVMNGLRKIVAE